MPICEADPWRSQYFRGVSCPDDVQIPTEDGDAWLWYPAHRWVYNKLSIAESQDFACGPHGIDPPAFPVFSKPIYNMRGMGAGSRVIRSQREYTQLQRPGHMWMPLLSGEHVSSDVAVVDGTPMWFRHTTAVPLEGGMFDHWVVEADPRPATEATITRWIKRQLGGYTGMVNLETIGGGIIEVHLRFSDQWPDLYGAGWVDALIRLYAEKVWAFSDQDRRTGYSVVLFGAHGIQYRHPPADAVAEVIRNHDVSSVQVTFHEDRPPASHSMPPGGFRLAIVNGTDLAAARDARAALALSFWSTQSLLPRRRKAAAARSA